jgi:hypothetical protein
VGVMQNPATQGRSDTRVAATACLSHYRIYQTSSFNLSRAAPTFTARFHFLIIYDNFGETRWNSQMLLPRRMSWHHWRTGRPMHFVCTHALQYVPTHKHRHSHMHSDTCACTEHTCKHTHTYTHPLLRQRRSTFAPNGQTFVQLL